MAPNVPASPFKKRSHRLTRSVVFGELTRLNHRFLYWARV